MLPGLERPVDDMTPLSLTGRLAACCAAVALGWWMLGPIGLAVTAPLWGIAFARPLIDAASAFTRSAQHAALRDLEGRHYAHAGVSIDVIETEDARWLRAADVQRVLGDRSPEPAFARRLGPGQALEPRPGRWYLRDGALWEYLEHSSQAMDARRNSLRLFIQRDIIDPHRRARRQRGA
jgi:hypothetical protein